MIGCPLGHSFSKKFFDNFFRDKALDASYDLFELSAIEEIEPLLLNPNLRGLNVTSPYKEAVLAYADELSPIVAELGASNVLKIERQEGAKPFVKAYNTDVIGFQKSLQGVEGLHKALILGSGGASRSVALALSNMGIEPIFVSRKKSEEIAEKSEHSYITYSEVIDYLPECDILVNATPVGFHLDEAPLIPYEALSSRHLVYDLIYNPEETLFLKRAKEQGAKTKNGLEMLHLQALSAWEIWSKG